jgi:hypothetical protein
MTSDATGVNWVSGPIPGPSLGAGVPAAGKTTAAMTRTPARRRLLVQLIGARLPPRRHRRGDAHPRNVSQRETHPRDVVSGELLGSRQRSWQQLGRSLGQGVARPHRR